ncbi:DUF6350 family protein [Kineococcus gynurae]|uniref:DUF6350 family protein n=1 Tax=Kineococcus gynurae TaxID=452979 RepID=A0ABV5LT78_9ACTN
MSETAPRTPTASSTRSRTPSVTAADLLPLLGAAVRAVLTLLVPVVVLTIVGWIAAVRSTNSLAAVVRVGSDLWLLGQGATVSVVNGAVGIAPLGLTLLAVLSARRAVRIWIADQRESERDVPFWSALGTFTAAHGGLALLLALATRSSVTTADPGQSFLGGMLVGAAGAAWAMAGFRTPLPAVPGRLAGARRALRAAVPAAVAAVTALLGAGGVLLAGALWAGADRVLLLHESLGPGVLGGALLTLGQAFYVPTFLVWAVAWLAGPGVAVGVGTSVAPGGTSLATLPAIPLAGALPATGPSPLWWWLAVLVPVLVGAGVRRLAPRGQSLPAAGISVALTALLAGTATALLAFFAAGPAGAGRMADLGPDPLLLGLVLAGELAAGGGLAVLLARGVRRLRPQRIDLDTGTVTPRPGPLLGRRSSTRGDAEDPGVPSPPEPDASRPASAVGRLRARLRRDRG